MQDGPDGLGSRGGDGLLVLPTLLLAAAVLVGLVLLLRPRLKNASTLEADPLSPRISADVRSGEEQVMIRLTRSLTIAVGRDQVGYGEIYVVSSTDDVIKLASRSEIGRGFDGEIRLHRGRRGTVAEYFLLRLPDDETLHARVLRLERQIAEALRGMDDEAEVRMRSGEVAAQRGPRAHARAAVPVPRAGQRSNRSPYSARRTADATPSDSFR
jgi:hypothetical protein